MNRLAADQSDNRFEIADRNGSGSQAAKALARYALGPYREKNLPILVSDFLKAIKNRFHIRKVDRLIVFVSIGSSSVDEPSIWPGLTRCGSKPVITNCKLLC